MVNICTSRYIIIYIFHSIWKKLGQIGEIVFFICRLVSHLGPPSLCDHCETHTNIRKPEIRTLHRKRIDGVIQDAARFRSARNGGGFYISTKRRKTNRCRGSERKGVYVQKQGSRLLRQAEGEMRKRGNVVDRFKRVACRTRARPQSPRRRRSIIIYLC